MWLQHEHMLDQIFPSHSVCWAFRSDLIALHALGDGLTAISYFLIPICLYYVTRKYHFHKSLKLLLWTYAAFIFLCGSMHLIDLIMIWYNSETLLIFDGILGLTTAAVSLFAAGITAFVAAKFLAYSTKFFGLAAEMAEQRKEHDRIHTETWNAFNEMREELRGYLKKDEPLEG